MMLDVMPNTAPQAKAERVKALAISSAKRMESHPELSTIAESGIVGFDAVAWDGIYAPANTPQPIVD